jgi:hypothetical protein
MFSTYSDFLTQLGKSVTFEGDNPGDASIGTLQMVLVLAETRINRELRTSYNEAAFSGTTTSNVFTLPSDFRSASIVHVGGKPLEPVSIEFLTEFLDESPSGDGRYFATVARTLKFGPALSDGTSVQGYYFKAFAAIDDTTFSSNTLIAAAPDLYMAACMAEAAPMYGFQDQLALWDNKYQYIRDRMNDERERAAYSAGRAKVRNSTRLLG